MADGYSMEIERHGKNVIVGWKQKAQHEFSIHNMDLVHEMYKSVQWNDKLFSQKSVYNRDKLCVYVYTDVLWVYFKIKQLSNSNFMKQMWITLAEIFNWKTYNKIVFNRISCFAMVCALSLQYTLTHTHAPASIEKLF